MRLQLQLEHLPRVLVLLVLPVLLVELVVMPTEIRVLGVQLPQVQVVVAVRVSVPEEQEAVAQLAQVVLVPQAEPIHLRIMI